MSSMREICLKYPITDAEYRILDKQFGKLCWKVSHELKRKNSKNNFTDDPEDTHQRLIMAMLCAGSYQKRQLYIERSIILLKTHAADKFCKLVLAELEFLWDNRKKHGANKQKFGGYQEEILENLLQHFVPQNTLPSPSEPLLIDARFSNYCRSIIYNEQKNMGKKITKEKAIRNGSVSLSEFDHMSGISCSRF